MKKVLMAFDDSNFSEGSFEFVRRLNEIQPLLTVGLFIPQVDYSNLWSYAAAAGGATLPGPSFIPLVEKEEEDLVNKNIKRFEELCKKYEMPYRVHKDFLNFALPELKKETRFADVVILGSEIFYNNFLEGNQFEYLREALHAADSPVVLVPEKYDFPTNNILAYDGSEESVYAIKQFAYIFPELARNPTLLIYAKNSEDSNFPSEEYIKELVTQHYKNISYYKLDINPKEYFSTWMHERKSSIIISGSFGRSIISQLFKKSFITEVIQDHKIPAFIAHK